MNFIEDVLERFPSARPALVTISRDGERRVWGFGELIARSAGLSGAFAARGVGRGDVVMTLVGNRIEWVLTMLACWRMGAVALPCNTQLRRQRPRAARLGAPNPTLCVGEEELLGELPDGVPDMTLAEVAAVMDEERPQEPPADAADLDPEDPALIVFTSGTTGEPRGALHTQRYLAGQRLQAEHWLGARERRARLVHDRDRLVEVGAQRLRRAVALRRGRAAPRRALRPGRAPRADRARGGQRPLPGADRVPDARQARRAPPACRRCAGWSRPASRSTRR